MPPLMVAPNTIDEYLRALPEDQRRALERLRAQIKAAAPSAQEYIGYGLAGFKLNGRPLIYIGAAKNHCAIYGARADDALADKLKGYKQSKGTIQFTPDKPIPAALVKQIVKARIAALETRTGATKTKAPAKKAVAAVRKSAVRKSTPKKTAPKKSATKTSAARKPTASVESENRRVGAQGVYQHAPRAMGLRS